MILLAVYDRYPKKEVKFTRHNIFERDKNTCQYCGKVLDKQRSISGSRDTKRSWWSNQLGEHCLLVHPLQHSKIQSNTSEAGMRLIKEPVKPKWRPFVQVHFSMDTHSSWRHFLDIAYWHVEIGEDLREICQASRRNLRLGPDSISSQNLGLS